jgi:hypothetical protein
LRGEGGRCQLPELVLRGKEQRDYSRKRRGGAIEGINREGVDITLYNNDY